ncbi:MAG: hypothetical protein AAGE84_10775 [Cyanobacteria bacterium P01_G01_bin.39]
MSKDDMPSRNQEIKTQQNCQKQNTSNLYSQNGNHGMGHMGGGEIKDNAQVIGKSKKQKNNNKQSQEVVTEIHFHSSSESDSSKKKVLQPQAQKYSSYLLKKGIKKLA